MQPIHHEYPPTVTIKKDAEAASQFAAEVVIGHLITNPSLSMTVPTGSTPIQLYKLLVDAYTEGLISFAKVSLFNLDEYWPIDPTSPDSYASYMRQHLIDQVDVDERLWHIPKGNAPDPEVEANEFDSSISRSNVDLAILGLGPGLTNHLGFNEPGSAFSSRTRLVKILDETKQVNRQHFENPDDLHGTAITQGLGTILEAKEILLLAIGFAKAAGVKRFLQGVVGLDSPASCLRIHPNVQVVLDEEAASEL